MHKYNLYYILCIYKPDAMARAAIDMVNMYIGGAGLNGYTVISYFNKMLIKIISKFILQLNPAK